MAEPSSRMEEFGRYRNGDLPHDLVEKTKAAATREISDFSVSLISQQEVLGSGTLVTASDAVGILTAHHVAQVIAERGEAVGVNISEHIHQFFLLPTLMEIRPVGTPANPARPEDGPDLSVIKILDPHFLSTLRSRKSLYRLEGRSFEEEFAAYPFQEMPWWVMGSPAEFSTHEGEVGTPEHILGAVHFAAEATFVALTRRGDFDFAEVRITAGSHGFPVAYGGVSGGGIWITPFTLDPEVGFKTMGYASPFLAGVAYYQGPLEGTGRSILGHGPESIYRHAREVLAAV